MRFIAIASVSCTSWPSEPKLIAPVMKRRMIASSGSTSSSGTAGPAGLIANSPRKVLCRSAWSLICAAYFW